MPAEELEPVMAMTDVRVQREDRALFCVGYKEAPQTGQCVASRV